MFFSFHSQLLLVDVVVCVDSYVEIRISFFSAFLKLNLNFWLDGIRFCLSFEDSVEFCLSNEELRYCRRTLSLL